MNDTVVRLNGVALDDPRRNAVRIHKVLNPNPDTATITLNDTVPVEGQSIEIALVTESPERLLFSGQAQRISETYDLQATNARYDVQAVGRTFKANRRRPFGTFTDVSASTVAHTLAATYAPDCSTSGIQAGLPTISIIFDGSQPFMTCWQALAVAVGNGCSATINDANDLGLFTVDPYEAPDPIDAAHPPLNNQPIVFSPDLSQVRTRVFGKGYAGTLQSDVLEGETILPITAADAAVFEATGGQAIAGTTAGGAQSEILNYTGVQLGGGGSLVGPGAAPGAAPPVTLSTGSTLGVGTYGYAKVYVTAAGKSLPSPIATVVSGTAVAPPASPTVDLTSGTNLANGTYGVSAGDQILVECTYSIASSSTDTTQDTAVSNAFPNFGLAYLQGSGGTYHSPIISVPYSTDPNVNWVHLWFSIRGGNFYSSLGAGGVRGGGIIAIPNNPAGGFSGPLAWAGWDDGGNIPPTPNAILKQATIGAIAAGPAGVTGLEYYRTVVNGSQLKLLHTVGASSSAPFVDTVADGSLGANAPTSDTSGLTQPSGQVIAGETSLLAADVSWANAAGGWAIIGNGQQAIRYTGISGNTLTGIPASGPGAILTALVYGSQVVPAPALVGVTNAGSPSAGVPMALAKGSTVAIWVQRDDLAARAALAALEGGDGIREDIFIDGRMGVDLLTASCDALLDKYSRAIVTVSYATLDLKSRVGAIVSIGLTTPVIGVFNPAVFSSVFGTVTGALPYGLSGDFTIQDIEISLIGARLTPRFDVTASSFSFTVMDLFRLAQLG